MIVSLSLEFLDLFFIARAQLLDLDELFLLNVAAPLKLADSRLCLV